MDGVILIIGFDVWEYVYYLCYQNKCVDYVVVFWNVVDWEKVNVNFCLVI